jgi:DICT domain-containing protein/predicted DNA-binding transcriptional regulator AlpA
MSRIVPADDATLTIGDVAARTGVSIATLRAWELRYGFPEPVRLENGHRRYRPSDVDRVHEVERHRGEGLRMPDAISRTRTTSRHATIFSALRAECPQLTPHRLTKRAMRAISHAIEDECCAVATKPFLIGAFQTERFYAGSRARWRDLSRTASFVAVLADFPKSRRTRGGVVEVAVASGDAMRREWAVVCDAPGASAVLAGWEIPGQSGISDSRRRFEAVWSADPHVVRGATQAALALVSAFAGRERSVTEDQLPPVAGIHRHDLQRTTALTNRMIAALDR